VATGRVLQIAGQIGWDESEKLVSAEFVPQFDRALMNVVTVVEAAGGSAEDITNMTIFVTDLDAYREAGLALGKAWRARMGKNYPAMALIGCAGLLEKGALVEILATAVLPEEGA
jgi:enamine deaminase RidA (YjgF/YER057c/UK114 family)